MKRHDVCARVRHVLQECLEFADYTFEEHFGRPIPSYPPRAVLHDYIKGRVRRSGVREQIRFCSPVRGVEFDEKMAQFQVPASIPVNRRRPSQVGP